MTQSQLMEQKLASNIMKNRFLTAGIRHLSLFGSYARNEATSNSDLDLLIELSENNKVTIGTLENLQEMLKKELSVQKVDFVTKRKISPYLRQSIEKDLITIF
ncbi:MAG: nucleotidyltransferase domain-containing protein [Candidatus Gracilibacteria bacterium]|nr:nucleotidyltransferase domain-containing protein [Candidatus Gracilibacteria bacterium]